MSKTKGIISEGDEDEGMNSKFDKKILQKIWNRACLRRLWWTMGMPYQAYVAYPTSRSRSMAFSLPNKVYYN